MTDARRPVHLAVLIGASAGLFAVSLAAVTSFQSMTDRATAAARAPVLSSLDSLVRANDRLMRRADEASSAYARSRAVYDALAPRLAGAERRLDDLAAAVADVQGAARTLPTRVALPVVGSAPRAAVPTVHATTRASGG